MLEPVALEDSCVTCHQAIHAGELDGQYKAKAIERWQDNVHSLVDTPDLVSLSRYKREWLVDYLTNPVDLRPDLDGEMPRLDISRDDAQTLVDWLQSQSVPVQTYTRGDPVRGRRLAQAAGCPTCHVFAGLANWSSDGAPLAPDLRFTRERLEPSVLMAWLRDPQKMVPGTSMPTPSWTYEQRADVATFLLEAPLDTLEPAKVPKTPRVLERVVTYEEVERRVFKRVCWHCHSARGGPGNTGGFGYAGAGLDLGSGADHISPEHLEKLVPSMMARHAEVAGQRSDVLGMPLGLPAMPLQEVQLVRTWVAQQQKQE